jgi:hypothetical protein
MPPPPLLVFHCPAENFYARWDDAFAHELPVVRFLQHVAYVRLSAAADDARDAADGAAVTTHDGAGSHRGTSSAQKLAAAWSRPRPWSGHAAALQRLVSSTSADAGTTLWYRGSPLPAGNGALNLLAHSAADYLAHWGPRLLSLHVVPAAARGAPPPPSQDSFDSLVRALPLDGLREAVAHGGPTAQRSAAAIAALRAAAAGFGVTAGPLLAPMRAGGAKSMPDGPLPSAVDLAANVSLSLADAWRALYHGMTAADTDLALLVFAPDAAATSSSAGGDAGTAPMLPVARPPTASPDDAAFVLVEDGETDRAEGAPSGMSTAVGGGGAGGGGGSGSQKAASAARWLDGSDVGAWYALAAEAANAAIQCTG